MYRKQIFMQLVSNKSLLRNEKQYQAVEYFPFFISKYYFLHIEMLKYGYKSCVLLVRRRDVEKLWQSFFERSSYGLNCFSLNSYVEALTPSVTVFGETAFRK